MVGDSIAASSLASCRRPRGGEQPNLLRLAGWTMVAQRQGLLHLQRAGCGLIQSQQPGARERSRPLAARGRQSWTGEECYQSDRSEERRVGKVWSAGQWRK